VARSSAGAISYEVTSPQRTAVEAVRASTLVVTRRYFDPYGNLAATVPASWPDADSYLGKPEDPYTSLDLLRARQYDPVTGGFLSVDPVLETGSPQQMGRVRLRRRQPGHVQ
jgi:RHS repeat-associated protein